MLGQTGMAARTDCVVLGDDSALLMVTVRTTPFRQPSPLPAQEPNRGGC